MATIYCDESGFDGPNLYHATASYFTYAGVAFEPDEAQQIVDRIKGFYRRFQGEVKFKNLIKRPEGIKAMVWVLEEYGSKAKIWFANKKFATAGKFYEYIFEPVLSDNSSLFYQRNFHRFVQNLLYSSLSSSERDADEMLADLQRLIREMNPEGLVRLFAASSSAQTGITALDAIAAFALGYRDKILESVNDLIALGEEGKWTMDLTSTALITVGKAHGREHEGISLICDTSKPLKASLETVEAIIQADFRNPLIPPPWRDRAKPVVLEQPIRIGGLHESLPGLDLADLFAGMARSALDFKAPEPIEGWRYRISPLLLHESIEAELNFIDLDKADPFKNAVVLDALADRARKGEDPLVDMDLYYRVLDLQYGF